MKLKAVLFDLDGTLLPMDQDEFTKGYFGLLAKKMAPLGYEPKELIDAVWSGTAEMMKNDGAQSNESVFWQKFAEKLGQRIMDDRPAVEDFYEKEFQLAKNCCGFDENAAKTVKSIKEFGLRVALLSNPIFPLNAMESRARWAGLDPSDFELVTSYENCGFCKPSPGFYLTAAEKLGLAPDECLMAGNDVWEDMQAQNTGMNVFLLTACLINKKNEDISAYPQGGFKELEAFAKKLCK